MERHLAVWGLGLWLTGTLAVRMAGQHLFIPGGWGRMVTLFALSFPACFWLVRALCRRTALLREAWPVGAASLLLPTLVLDAFTSAFFPVVFPNVNPQMAGVFGGWMLWCCGAGLLGGLARRG
jgi:hypothetical protein